MYGFVYMRKRAAMNGCQSDPGPSVRGGRTLSIMALGVPDLMTIASFSDALQHHLSNNS